MICPSKLPCYRSRRFFSSSFRPNLNYLNCVEAKEEMNRVKDRKRIVTRNREVNGKGERKREERGREKDYGRKLSDNYSIIACSSMKRREDHGASEVVSRRVVRIYIYIYILYI